MSDSGPDLERVERQVDAFFAESGQPGLAYGVLRHGVLLHAGGRGLTSLPRAAGATGPGEVVDPVVPGPDTVFRIASMTKSFTASAVLLLRDEAAGFPTDDPWGDRQQGLPLDDFARLLEGGLSFAWAPGVAFEYSNLGYALLGRVVAAAPIEQKFWEEFCDIIELDPPLRDDSRDPAATAVICSA